MGGGAAGARIEALEREMSRLRGRVDGHRRRLGRAVELTTEKQAELASIEARGPVPAIALAGYGMEEDVRRSREAGFSAHLTNPIDLTRLEAMIQQVTPDGIAG